MSPIRRLGLAVVPCLAAMIGPAMAQSYDLVQNGNFTELATQTSSEFGSLYSGQQVTDWSTSGYNFVFLPNTADSTGAVGQFSTLKLWGPGSGSANGFTATAPGGGNIIGGDGAYQVGAVSQTLTGLKVGDTIAVKFDWAGAQQSGYTTSTTENWKVSLGSSSQTTATVNNAAKGFTGWMGETFDFVATSSSETLSFLAAGTPNGQPPFSLLSNVSAQDITEHPMNPAPLPALGATPFGVLACAAVAAGKLRRKRARSA